MGGWLWKDYEDGNIDFPTLWDHDSQIVDGRHLCVPCKEFFKGDTAEFHSLILHNTTLLILLFTYSC